MNIDDLTIGQARELAATFGGAAAPKSLRSPHLGKECIIRSNASGVHFGTLVSQHGQTVELKDARRLWRWFARGGISLSEVARNGIDEDKSRVCITVPQMTILDALEIIPVWPCAAETIRYAEVAKP